MTKRLIVTFSGIVCISLLLFISGDYFALFGTRDISKYEFIEMNFKPVDENTGAPVIDVHARCFQNNNSNACTERNSRKAGILTINIPVTKQITKSFLFQQDMRIQDTKDPKLHIMFVHQDYANPVETYLINEISSYSNELITVSMPRSIFNR
jgi:hypothetical protein